MQYFFILGRNPELSLAELHAVLPEKYTLHTFFREIAIVECKKLDAETLMRRLGGTIKMGGIFLPLHNPSQPPGSALARPVFDPLNLRGGDAADPPLKIRGGRGSYDDILQLLTASQSKDKKLFLGLSAYALDTRTRLPSVRELRELGIEVKRELQAGGHKVRLVTSKKITLSSVIVKREKLLTQGAEIVLMYGGPSSGGPEDGPPYIGKTLAVQEFAEASARDFGRPERSMGVGMLPIQLTKIMLNLSRAPKDATILDPFCGLGTVLTEAIQMGYTNLIGTDLEQKMIDATRQNLTWLTKHNRPFSVSPETENVKLLTTPVEKLSEHLPPRSVNAIVTEPYLGPTRGQLEINTLIAQLSTLYIAAFREFLKILKPAGRVVFIFPAFKHGSQLTKTSDRVLPEIKKLGFEPMQLLPTSYPIRPTYSITYSRPDQKVLREIFVLEFHK